mgnify:CR=1 FL=1
MPLTKWEEWGQPHLNHEGARRLAWNIQLQCFGRRTIQSKTIHTQILLPLLEKERAGVRIVVGEATLTLTLSLLGRGKSTEEFGLDASTWTAKTKK